MTCGASAANTLWAKANTTAAVTLRLYIYLEGDKPRQGVATNRLKRFGNGDSLLANAFGVGFIDWLAAAMASSPVQCLERLRQRLPPIHHECLTRDKACLFRG